VRREGAQQAGSCCPAAVCDTHPIPCSPIFPTQPAPRNQRTNIHCKADVGCTQRWSVVGAVARDRHHVFCEAAHACWQRVGGTEWHGMALKRRLALGTWHLTIARSTPKRERLLSNTTRTPPAGQGRVQTEQRRDKKTFPTTQAQHLPSTPRPAPSFYPSPSACVESLPTCDDGVLVGRGAACQHPQLGPQLQKLVCTGAGVSVAQAGKGGSAQSVAGWQRWRRWRCGMGTMVGGGFAAWTLAGGGRCRAQQGCSLSFPAAGSGHTAVFPNAHPSCCCHPLAALPHSLYKCK